MQDKTSNSEPSTTKRKGSPETKSTGDARIFLKLSFSSLPSPIPSMGAVGEGAREGALWHSSGVLSCGLVWFLLGTEGQALLQPPSGPARHRAVPAEKLQQKAVLNTWSDVWLALEGKGNFLPVLPFTLELGLLQPVRWNEELFFVFYPERLFRKEWLLKYWGRFCW